MIKLYYWPTPNGHKITIFLEEANLPYELVPINIHKGEQFDTNFLKISPNNKVPAILDHSPIGSKNPLALFESGAILLYLAEKSKRFLPEHSAARYKTLQWLFWQVAGLGPMAGQNHHFTQYANEEIPYAIDRYVNETSRLYAVLNKQLSTQEYITGSYSIADMACYPWVVPHEKQQQDLNDFPSLKRWFDLMSNRPAVKRAYALREIVNPDSTMSKEAKKVLFGQNKETIR